MYMTLVWWPKRKRVSTESVSSTERLVVLTDKQWSLFTTLFPWTPPSQQGGLPKAHPRDCLEGILWILVTGARRKDLPKEYPSPLKPPTIDVSSNGHKKDGSYWPSKPF